MNYQFEITERVAGAVKELLREHESGHGWLHIERVMALANHICNEEGEGNRLIIELGALMHDIGDHKFNLCDGPTEIRRILGQAGAGNLVTEEVVNINRNISFSKGEHDRSKSIELQIVQDADRIDAMGAVGIARAFSYGGYKGNEIYDPAKPTRLMMAWTREITVSPARREMPVAPAPVSPAPVSPAPVSPEGREMSVAPAPVSPEGREMSNNLSESRGASTINHFFEKLLLLKGLLNTGSGRRMAEERHNFMILYLQQFFSEWNEANSF